MSNLTNNRINVTLTASQITNVKNSFQNILANLPMLTGLTVEERSSLPKIDVNNKIFTEDAINAAVNNASLLPSYVSITNMQNDLTLYTQLDELLGLARQLCERLEDTQMLAGSEAYVNALTAYKLFVSASEAGIQGTDSIVSQLKQRFSSSGNTTTTPPSTPPTP